MKTVGSRQWGVSSEELQLILDLIEAEEVE